MPGLVSQMQRVSRRLDRLIYRYRRQASSHIFTVFRRWFLRQRKINVGVGLPAMRVCQSSFWALVYRYRRQASSHIFYRVRVVVFASAKDQCVSWLARDEGVTVSLLGTGLPLSQASQLPHCLPCSGGGFAPAEDQCGRGLARDEGVSNKLLGTGLPLSQASQLPHFLPCSGGGFCVSRRSMWERACQRCGCVSQAVGGWFTAIAGKPAPTFFTVFGR